MNRLFAVEEIKNATNGQILEFLIQIYLEMT